MRVLFVNTFCGVKSTGRILTTLEALSCGTPAIIYERTACEEVARKYGGIVVEQNIDGLYQSIVKLKAESGWGGVIRRFWRIPLYLDRDRAVAA